MRADTYTPTRPPFPALQRELLPLALLEDVPLQLVAEYLVENVPHPDGGDHLQHILQIPGLQEVQIALHSHMHRVKPAGTG